MKLLLKYFLIVIISFGGLKSVEAQQKDNTAAQLPEATTLNNLNFGMLVTGTARDVLITEPNAAKFYLKSGAEGEYVIKLVLPKDVSNGRTRIPVKFDVTHAAWSFEDNPGTSNTFDPKQDLTISPRYAGSKIYIWVGGAISAANNIESGPYTGVITLSITKK